MPLISRRTTTRPRTRRLAAALAALTIPLAGGADAVAMEAPLPVGEARGIRIERDRGELVVVFTRRAAALHRQLVGERVRLDCSDVPDEPRLGVVTGGSGSIATYRVPQGRTLRTQDRTSGLDLCRLFRAPRTVRRDGARVRRGPELIASVPLTQVGAILLDEETRGVAAYGVLSLAGELAARGAPPAYPTPDRLIAWLDARGRGAPHHVVALAAPTDMPAGGDVGYYSDGQRHAAVATLSATGRRLYLELHGDLEVSTNMPWLFSDEFR